MTQKIKCLQIPTSQCCLLTKLFVLPSSFSMYTNTLWNFPTIHIPTIPVGSENESCSVVSDFLRPHELYSPWNSSGQNTGMDSLSLLQGIFPTQESNPGLLHCRQSLPAEPQGKPKNTGVGSLSLLQRIFLTQELNWGVLCSRRILYRCRRVSKIQPGNKYWLCAYDLLYNCRQTRYYPCLPWIL